MNKGFPFTRGITGELPILFGLKVLSFNVLFLLIA